VSVIPGDPASLSSCAVTVRTVGGLLGPDGAALAAAIDDLDGWTGPVSAATRRRAGDLAGAATTAAGELDRVATVLQDHATDLADLVARARLVEERAVAAGLTVRDRRVVPAWGVTGEADAGAADDRAATASALQHELDLVLAQHARRRDWVLGVLRESGERLAEVSHLLRRG
jgi:hypothetical protein